MTVALVLAGDPGEAAAGLRGRLAALGVRRVDVAGSAGPGLLTVAAAARTAGERVLICGGPDTVPEPVLARLLRAGRTAAFTGTGAGIAPPVGPAPGRPHGQPAGAALVVDPPDLDALARAAESLAPGSAGPAAVGALTGELARRGVTIRILDAGPDSEGAVAQLLADPSARNLARWAAGRGLSPEVLYGISLGLGLIAALWYAGPAVRARLLAAAALAASFLAARAGSLIAATGRRVPARPVVAWLGTACGLLTELAVYAALAASAGAAVPGAAAPGAAVPGARQAGLDGPFGGALRDTFVAGLGGAGPAGVWRLAIAALLVLAVRRMAGLGYEHTARPPVNLFPRSVLRIGEQVVTLPAGERLAVIAVTAVLYGPRLTFAVLLAWGVVAAGYVLAGQAARSADPDLEEDPVRPGGGLAAYRGDGGVSHWIGGLVQGRLPPLPPVLAGLIVTGVLAAVGMGDIPSVLLLTPAIMMMLAALGASHPHDGRLDWLVPALLMAGECVFLAAVGLSRHVAGWLVFLLLAAVVMRHVDLAFRARAGRGLPLDGFGLGWEGRMLLAGLAAGAGYAPFACAAISGYLWVLFIWDFLSGWLRPADGDDG